MRRGLPLLILLVTLALAGCFGEDSSPVAVTPYLPQHEVEPGAGVLVPVYVNSTFTFKQELPLRVGELPEGWTYRLPDESLVIPGWRGRYVVYEILTPAGAAQGPREVDVFVGDTRARVNLLVRPLEPAVRAGMGLNVSWVHLDANGTVLGHHEPMLRERLRMHPDATVAPDPLLVYVGAAGEEGVPEPYASAGYRRLPAPMEEKLLGAKVGTTLLLDAAPPPDPFSGAPGAGEKVLLRLVRAQEPGEGAA